MNSNIHITMVGAMKLLPVLFSLGLFSACAGETQDLRGRSGSSDLNANRERRVVDAEMQEDEGSYILKVLSASAEPGKYVLGLVDQPAMGKVSLGKKASGVVEYTPDPNANGPDHFVVAVVPDNDKELELRVEVNINIVSVPDAPVITPEKLDLQEDTFLDYQVKMVDPDGDKAILKVAEAPKSGKLEVVDPSKGLIRYTPNQDATGTDSFKLSGYDGELTSEPVAFSVTIEAVNDKPTIRSTLSCTKMNNQQPIPLFGEDLVEKSKITYVQDLERKPSLLHGRISVFAQEIGVATYDPTLTPNFQGWDLFYVSAFDQEDLSDSAPMYVVVYGDQFNVTAGTVLQSSLVTFQNVEAQDGPQPKFQFFADPSTAGTLEIADPTKPNFKFTPNANVTAGTDVDLTFRVKLNDVEAKQCGFKVHVTN